VLPDHLVEDHAELGQRSLLEGLGNFVTMLGALVVFNGFFMTILGFMTEFGVTTEATAKWHEIHVTPGQSDTFGLMLLGGGIVVTAIGYVIARAGRRQG